MAAHAPWPNVRAAFERCWRMSCSKSEAATGAADGGRRPAELWSQMCFYRDAGSSSRADRPFAFMPPILSRPKRTLECLSRPQTRASPSVRRNFLRVSVGGSSQTQWLATG